MEIQYTNVIQNEIKRRGWSWSEFTDQVDAQRVLMEWDSPELRGVLPFSQNMAVQSIIHEFDLRGITRLALYGCITFPEFCGGLLGVESRRGAVYFLDCGSRIVPVGVVWPSRVSSRTA